MLLVPKNVLNLQGYIVCVCLLFFSLTKFFTKLFHELIPKCEESFYSLIVKNWNVIFYDSLVWDKYSAVFLLFKPSAFPLESWIFWPIEITLFKGKLNQEHIVSLKKCFSCFEVHIFGISCWQWLIIRYWLSEVRGYFLVFNPVLWLIINSKLQDKGIIFNK